MAFHGSNWSKQNVGKFGDLVAGIDPSISDIPDFFDAHDGVGVDRYVNFLLETIQGHVGFVRFQSAYFEACGLAGLKALSSGISKARAAGMAVILGGRFSPAPRQQNR